MDPEAVDRLTKPLRRKHKKPIILSVSTALPKYAMMLLKFLTRG
jgi:hypothetical protein